MRITESNMTLASQWAHLRPDDPSTSTHGADTRPAAAVAAASSLDTDRDGWLDEDDIPYDQLERLARKAEDNAELGGIHLDAAVAIPPASGIYLDAAVAAPPASEAAPPVPAPAPTPPAAAEPTPEPRGGAGHVDLLA
jgi:hypothetical protein